MKLKLRLLIIVIGATFITASLIVTVARYFFTGDYPIHEEVHGVVTVTSEGESLQNRVFKEFRRLQLTTKKFKELVGVEIPPTKSKDFRSVELPTAKLEEFEGLVLPTAKFVRIVLPTTKKTKKVIVKMKNRRKERMMKMMSVTYPDSNQAAEIELSEKEYVQLLKNKHMLKPSTSPDLKPMNHPHSKKELKSRFIRDCVHLKLIPDIDDDREGFEDLVYILQKMKSSQTKFGQDYHRNRITIQDIHGIELLKNLTLMEQFHLKISDQDLYEEHSMLVPSLLKEMSTIQISHVEEKPGGTQLKLIITFHDGNQALMKPMRSPLEKYNDRFDRDKETLPDHFYFVDFERHNSEIAAFHLDRILGFRRCPPVVGRKLNMTTEIYAVADDEIIKTFFISPAQNYCFHGQCSYYCDTSHAICGHPDDLEGSLAAFLPPDQLSGRKSWKNPWKRTYHKRRKANWETNDDYCDVVRQMPLYNNSKRLADLIDMHILDFMIGNMDRHHYETFKIFGNDSFILHLDHGRGFGKSKHDEISILAPLYQCCFINAATFERLLQLQKNPTKLSTLMYCSLYYDPLNPILNDAHLEALDRRLQIVLEVLRDCLTKKDWESVLFRGKRQSYL